MWIFFYDIFKQENTQNIEQKTQPQQLKLTINNIKLVNALWILKAKALANLRSMKFDKFIKRKNSLGISQSNSI
jgi:hypothetical protein